MNLYLPVGLVVIITALAGCMMPEEPVQGAQTTPSTGNSGSSGGTTTTLTGTEIGDALGGVAPAPEGAARGNGGWNVP